MDEEIITIFYFCDEYLKSLSWKKGWFKEKMSDAEVMTVMLVGTKFFYGNIERARKFLGEYGYVRNILDILHRIPDNIWKGLLEFDQATVFL